MSKVALLAIDQGTTSSRAILFSVSGDIIDVAQKELTLHYPHSGWVEQDPFDIWDDTLWACQKVISSANEAGYEIAGIGITNQRETTIVWDKKTGKPVYNAIVWQDRRTAEYCRNLKAKGHEEVVSQKTGLLLDPYFSATKIVWILENVNGVRERACSGELLFGTVECWLLWNLTGGPDGGVHASDVTNASRTMLYNVQTQDWDADLLALFDIPRALLPDVHDNVYDFGKTAPALFDVQYQIGGMAGDQQSALIGQACFLPGMVKSTYGTGCFALMNIGADFQVSKNRLLTTIAYRFDGKICYAVEGSIFIAGAAVQWLRDGLQIIDHAAETQTLATSVNDNGGVYFVPAFTGLGAPYWQPDAKGMISGLGRDTTKAHIVRAALEAQAYQTLDLMDAMKGDSRQDIKGLRVDGGLVANEFVCQFLADMLEVVIEVPKVTETTAWGAACLAGMQSGVFKGVGDIQRCWSLNRCYDTSMDDEKCAELYKGWRRAISMVQTSKD